MKQGARLYKQFFGAVCLAALMASTAWSQNAYPPISGTLAGPSPDNPGSGAPFYASQLRSGYGLTGLAASGAGQTVAIVDAYDYPNALGALNGYSSTFNLPLMTSATFTQLNESGGTALPAVDPAGPISGGASDNWELEEALDIEMVHAMAPQAKIILYECTNNSYLNLFTAVNTARNNSAVSVVSMSWGGGEFGGETSYSSTLTTPAGRLAANPKQGVTFVASTGDDAAPGGFPAFSPNVVAAGGSNLYLTMSDSYSYETAWSGGGGGTSTMESKPAYQTSTGSLHGSVLQSITSRGTPDVSMVASNNTLVWTYDPYNGGYFNVYGTSVASPLLAGLFADADGIRSSEGYGTLDGPSQTLPALYNLPNSDFHDITSGNNGYPAGVGYDLATGLGSPVANTFVPDLANYGVPAPEPSTLALLGIAAFIALGRVAWPRIR
jgi:subtilase family serine protease